MNLWFLLLWGTTFSIMETGNPPSAIELVREVLAARTKLETGEIQMELCILKNESDARYEKVITEYSMVFKPGKVKIKNCDIYDRQRHPDIPCQTLVWLDGDSILVPMDNKYAVNYLQKQKRSLSELNLFHPWMLGTHPDRLCFFKHHEFDVTTLLPDEAQNIEINSDTLNGRFVWRISYVINNKERNFTCEKQTWIDPERGYFVLKSEAEAKSPQIDFRNEYEAKLKLFENVWFPEEIRSARKVKGNVVNEEVLRITKASFNHFVSDEEFDWKSLGLPIGREVHHDGKIVYWDGGKLVGTFVGSGIPESDPSSSRRWMVLLAVNAIICAYIAFRFYPKFQKNKN